MIVEEMNQVGTARWFQGNIFQVVLSSRLAASVDSCSLLLFGGSSARRYDIVEDVRDLGSGNLHSIPKFNQVV